MIEHGPDVRNLLHKAGLSMQTEMDPGRYKVAEAMEALEKNPRISQHRLLGILRPKGEEPEFEIVLPRRCAA